MAKKSSFAKFAGPRFTELVQRSVSEAVAALDADLKEGSPVDTGRFKASWFHAQVAADWFKSIAQRWESGKYLDAAFRNNSTPD